MVGSGCSGAGVGVIWHATARGRISKPSEPSTETQIGKQMPGKKERVACSHMPTRRMLGTTKRRTAGHAAAGLPQ